MQSTKQSPAFPTIYSTSAVYPKALPPEAKEHRGVDRSFMIACGLGAVTVIFGMAALVYQFTPEFNRLKNASSQGEIPNFSTLRG